MGKYIGKRREKQKDNNGKRIMEGEYNCGRRAETRLGKQKNVNHKNKK